MVLKYTKFYAKPDVSITRHKFRNYYSRTTPKDFALPDIGRAKVFAARFVYYLTDAIVNQPSGVYLDGIGYIYIHETFDRKMGWFKNPTRRFRLAFVPKSGTVFVDYTFDYAEANTFKQKINKRIRGGARYLNWTYALKLFNKEL